MRHCPGPRVPEICGCRSLTIRQLGPCKGFYLVAARPTAYVLRFPFLQRKQIAGAGFAGATGESRLVPDVIFCFRCCRSGKPKSRFLAAKAARNDNLL